MVKKTWIDCIRNNHGVIVIAEDEPDARSRFDQFQAQREESIVSHSSVVVLRDIQAPLGTYIIN